MQVVDTFGVTYTTPAPGMTEADYDDVPPYEVWIIPNFGLEGRDRNFQPYVVLVSDNTEAFGGVRWVQEDLTVTQARALGQTWATLLGCELAVDDRVPAAETTEGGLV